MRTFFGTQEVLIMTQTRLIGETSVHSQLIYPISGVISCSPFNLSCYSRLHWKILFCQRSPVSVIVANESLVHSNVGGVKGVVLKLLSGPSITCVRNILGYDGANKGYHAISLIYEICI